MKKRVLMWLVYSSLLFATRATIAVDSTNYVNDSMIKRLHAGKTTLAEAKKILGNPAFAKTNPNATRSYYYDMTKSRLLVLLFDKQGTLRKVGTLNEVDPSCAM